MATITKKEIVNRITEKHQVKRTLAKSTIQLFLDEITNELANGNRLEFRGFGVFEIKNRIARMAQNPKTLEKIQVPAKRKVKFKMGSVLEQRLNNKDTDSSENNLS